MTPVCPPESRVAKLINEAAVGAVYDRALSWNQQNTRGHRPRLQLQRMFRNTLESGSREGRVRSKPCRDAVLEPPLARSRVRLDRAALLTQEGKSPVATKRYVLEIATH